MIFLLLVPLLEFLFHEYIHVLVAKFYGVKVEYIVLNVFTLFCKYKPLPNTNPDRNKIYSRITLSGALFQSAIYSFVITFLILSGLSLQNITPIICAGAFTTMFIINDILDPDCDFMRVLVYAKKIETQRLSPLTAK